METKTKVLGAGAMAAAAAVGIGVAVSRRSNGGGPEVYHVRPVQDGWAVSKDGGNEPASTHGTKKEALTAGRKLASSQAPSTLVLYYADGRVQKRLTYATD